MHPSTYVEISRAALRHNAKAVCQSVDVPVIGVVKCNGYGVSVKEAYEAWRDAGVTMFAVSQPQEAIELRRDGCESDILLMCPVADRETLLSLLENRIILTVSNLENGRFYSSVAADMPIRAHMAVDTGMGRFGIHWTDISQIRSIYALPGFSFEGIFSHFSASFEERYQQTKNQLTRFLQVTDQLQAEGYSVGMRHIANSCAALRFPETRLDGVRIGSALVGRLPAPVPVELETVGVFRAKVVDRRCLLPGDTTGYGSYCTLKKRTEVIIVALGSEAGFGLTAKPDRLRSRDLAVYVYRLLQDWRSAAFVRHRGRKVPVVGRIGSQYTLCNAAGIDAQPGDWVEWNGSLLLSTCERIFV